MHRSVPAGLTMEERRTRHLLGLSETRRCQAIAAARAVTGASEMLAVAVSDLSRTLRRDADRGRTNYKYKRQHLVQYTVRERNPELVAGRGNVDCACGDSRIPNVFVIGAKGRRRCSRRCTAVTVC